jgi:hypothetical protein
VKDLGILHSAVAPLRITVGITVAPFRITIEIKERTELVFKFRAIPSI